MEQEQGREQEQPVDAVRRAEEGGLLERGSYDMMDPALYVPTNRSIAEPFSHFERRLHHITELHIQLQARLDRIDASQRDVHAKVIFCVERKTTNFVVVKLFLHLTVRLKISLTLRKWVSQRS